MSAGTPQLRDERATPRHARRLPTAPGLVCLLALGLLLTAAAESKEEYELKAIYLHYFAGYTIWPEGAFEDEQDEQDERDERDERDEAKAPLVIGVIGTYPFKGFLDDIAKKYRVGGRELVIKRFKDLAALQDCHMLFVGRSMERHVEALLEALEKKPVFTVSDLHGFAREGGVARFFVESGNVKFEINIDAARRAQLTISSQLLKLATILEDED